MFVVGICCCFGAATPAAAVVGFVVVCCDDDTVDVGGVADDNEGGFTVFGIPHIRDSVVLTTLRLGLLGSHISALSFAGTVVLLAGLPVGGDDNCCPYTIFPEKIVAHANIIVIAAISLDLVRASIVGNRSDSLTWFIRIKYIIIEEQSKGNTMYFMGR